MLGHTSARRVVELGRGAFFAAETDDLPVRKSKILEDDDLIPQFGYVGDNYATRRVLLIGINPGNGPDDTRRTPTDERMMPALRAFASDPTKRNSIDASSAYQAECLRWPIWDRHCGEVLRAGCLSPDDIAYANCLPWRTRSKARFHAIVKASAAELYVRPLIAELQPRIIVAMGKGAKVLLQMVGGMPDVIVWNRSQALTASVRAEREAAREQIRAAVRVKAEAQSPMRLM